MDQNWIGKRTPQDRAGPKRIKARKDRLWAPSSVGSPRLHRARTGQGRL